MEYEQGKAGIFLTRIAFVWAIVFGAICLYAVFWFMFGFMAMAIIEAVESAYTFTAPASYAVEIMKAVIAYHPVLAMFGWILWGYLNSQRREPREYVY